MTTTDENLTVARLRFDAAVHALIGVQVRRDDQGTFTAPGLLTQLAQQLHQRPRHAGSSKTLFQSQPTLDLAALSLKEEIDRTVAAWCQDRGDTQSMLDSLTQRKWLPDDAWWLMDAARTVAGWAAAVADLLSDQPTERNLPDACPADLDDSTVCGATIAYRDVDGERIRTTALVVALGPDQAPIGARCRVCGTTWGPDEVLTFADTLRWHRGESADTAA